MKKYPHVLTAHVAAGTPLFIISLCLTVMAFSNVSAGHRHRNQTVKSVTQPSAPEAPNPTQFSGTFSPAPYPCTTPRHHFMVSAGQTRLVVLVSATVPVNDITVTLLYGPDPNPAFIQTEDTGLGSEALVYQPPAGVPPGEYQVQICQAGNTIVSQAPLDYNGVFIRDDTPNPAAGSQPPPPGPIPPALQDSGAKIGFENFAAPGVLVQVKTTEAGQQPNSVEYMGRNAGEPSIGDNWLTQTAVFYSGLETLFVTFNDSCPANGASSTWVNRAAPTQIAVDSDPIGFTDSALGRSFTGELTLLSPSCKTSLTDNDGAVWVPTQGSGIASGVDHQTIGGGPFAAPLTRPTGTPVYPNAVYYCSQEGQGNSGLCSRSDDGGLTYGPSVPVTSPLSSTCSGLHGHVKVSPKDGAVYVPFNNCDGSGGLAVSLDNGVTWTVRHVATATVSTQPSASFQDPAISVDTTGRLYYVIANNDTDAAIATSDDHGMTWQNLSEVSSIYGLQNIRYPAATAGDAGRAAISFLGTRTPGDALQGSFPGIWHLYIANTFDGGIHWTVTDATPNAPMQRGCIWAKGGANICRNLLDFYDMTVDKFGRVEVGYVNGCEGGNCVQAPLTASGESPAGQGNAYTSTATIARQSSGRRLFSAQDATTPTTSKPGMPLLTQRRVDNVVYLQWSEADTGNLMINNYQILRGTASNAETPLVTVAGTQTGGSFIDVLPAGDTTTYYYKVVAVNTAGASCGNNEVAAPYLGTTCTGIIVHRNDPTHPEANAGTATPASLLIDYVAVGEPAGTSNLMFKMKVNSLATLPPNSRWRMVWDSFSAPGQQFYVGMRTDGSNPPVATFQYGTMADAGVPAVFVISEQTAIPALAGSGYQTDGTITLIVPKSAFGNPQPGTLLGAVNGRTFTGDTPETGTLHRSNAFVDHTFIKAQTDNGYPAATYLVKGNNPCTAGGIAPVGAVSRKTHGAAGDFDVDLPLTGPVGIEDRTGGANGDHKVVISFAVPVTVSAATVTPGAGGTASVSSMSVNGSTVTVNLTNVSNAQTLTVNLLGVSDGTNAANVSIPMGVLLGDTTADRFVNSADIAQTKSKSGQVVNASSFRQDVTIDGNLNSADIALVKSKSGTALP